jgi:hypothetical protein
LDISVDTRWIALCATFERRSATASVSPRSSAPAVITVVAAGGSGSATAGATGSATFASGGTSRAATAGSSESGSGATTVSAPSAVSKAGTANSGEVMSIVAKLIDATKCRLSPSAGRSRRIELRNSCFSSGGL